MKTRRRLFVVDPSLKDIRGHHYSLARSVSTSAKMSGFEVFWLASSDASPELLKNRELIPAFGHSMYDSYQTKNPEQPTFLRRGMRWLLRRWDRDVDGSAGAEPPDKEIDLKVSIRSDLERVFGNLDIGPSDRLLFHTADGATYQALAELLQGQDLLELPSFHVCTPYDPVGVMPNRSSAADVLGAIESFKESGLLGRRVFLHAENPLLAKHLSNIWDTHVFALDLPALPVSEDMKFVARRFRSDRLGAEQNQFLVVSLGAARLEKGFHLIPDIVRRVFEYAEEREFSEVDPARIKFVLQASAQIVGRHPVITQAIEKLQQFSKNQVELLMDPLSDEDYQSLTLAADAILMPYDEEAYRVRGSGIVSEAIVAKKFIIAKSGTYPAKMAEIQGVPLGHTPAKMARALLTIVKNRWQSFESVKQAAQEYVRDNAVEQYVKKLVFAERTKLKIGSDSADT